jgi:hypothetical protein
MEVLGFGEEIHNGKTSSGHKQELIFGLADNIGDHVSTNSNP